MVIIMDIEYLSDNIFYARKVAEWIYGEFIKDIRHGLSFDQILLSVKQCYKTELPVRLIAKVDGKCVGTVSVVHNDLVYRNYTPWLAALYVDKVYRNNKIGERLVERAKDVANDFGFDEIYLRTEHTGNYYKRLGWQYVESCVDEFKLETEIYRYPLR